MAKHRAPERDYGGEWYVATALWLSALILGAIGVALLR